MTAATTSFLGGAPLRTDDSTGEARVRVDGSTGDVFRLAAETERQDDGEDDGDGTDDGDDHEARLLLVDGTPAPGGTIVVRALVGDEPAAGVTVYVNDHAVAETDAHGEATITLPRASDVDIEAGDAALEFRFEDAEEEGVHGRLDATATLEGETVTVRVTFDGEPVEGATVEANDEVVGETDGHGVATFAFDPEGDDRLDLELTKGEFEAEFRFELHDCDLVLVESGHEVDDG